MPKSIEKREKLTLKANQRKENYENNIKVEISLISKIYSRVPQMLQTKIDQNRVTFGNFVPKCYKNVTFRNMGIFFETFRNKDIGFVTFRNIDF